MELWQQDGQKFLGAKHVILVDIDEQKTEFAKERDLNIVNSLERRYWRLSGKSNWKKTGRCGVEGTGSSAGFNQSIEYVKPFERSRCLEIQTKIQKSSWQTTARS